MAGGDGSLAVVAAVAAAHGIPFVCVPAGTHNHFALDVGVDRHDLTGAAGPELPVPLGRLTISAPAPPRPPTPVSGQQGMGARNQQRPAPTGIGLHPENPRVPTVLRRRC
jgi:Diacylglycerol kinase catalytic domain